MSIRGLDLNLVHRAGRRGLMVVVAADTVCAADMASEDPPHPVRLRPVVAIDPAEGHLRRAPGAAERSGYGRSRFDGTIGARIDLSC